MANKVQLQVELQSKIDQTKSAISTLKEKGGFKNNTKAEQQLSGLIKELESISKTTNPTLKQLSRIDALFNQLSEVLLKVAHATSTTSKEFKDLEKKLQSQQKSADKIRSERGGILKQGRINKNTNKYELFTSYQDDVIRQSNITNKKGQPIKTSETFLKKFDDQENPIKDAFQNPEAAKALYDSLKKTQTENATKLEELNKELEEYKVAINKTKTELSKQSKKEESPLAGTIIQNKLDVNSLIQDEKDSIHQAQDQAKATNEVQGFTKATEQQSSALGRAFKQFTIYNIAVRAAKTALREAVQTVKELDKYLTEQAMVTGLTRKQTYELVSSYQELALQCGATTKEIAQVATEYMKQGKSIQESLTLTQAAVSAAKVARVSVGDSVNYLTTALNGFRLSAEDAMKVSDKFAAVAASSATDYDELAIALSKVASQANLAGMSIDYTTALLTKGLETTREAPETMGTALKTIIARMRELGDYGETLGGDTDINKVESQLAYVGIALRDQQGELRSTEEVLDELGKKWDTLNKNQQAAIAKALAGTRQQSRLIAMMEDYERVTELQEISQRSAGATAAQAGVYLEGIEAAMNKIQVAWEKIIMTVTDSEIIIGIFDWIGNALDDIGDFLSTDWGVFASITLIATVAGSIVAKKMQELAQQRLINIENLKARENSLKQIKTQKENAKLKIQERKQSADILRQEKLQTLEEKRQNILNDTSLSDEERQIQLAALNKEESKIQRDYKQEIKNLNAEEKLLDDEINAVNSEITANLIEQKEAGSGILSVFGSFIPIISTIVSLMSLWSTVQSIVNAKKKASIKLTKEQGKEEGKAAAKSAGGMFANIVKAFASGGIPGVIIGLAIAAAAVAGIMALIGMAGAGISIAIKNIKEDKSAENAAKDVNKLSNEIYKLNEKANAINSIASSFDSLDGKLIKTNADLKEMNSLLDQAADKLSDEIKEDEDIGYGKGVSEKDYYNSLQSDRAKRKALDNIEKKARDEANKKRTEQINKIRGLSSSSLSDFLNENTTNAEILQAQDAIFALNNNELYEYIDKLKTAGDLTDEQAAATEALTQSLLDNMSVSEAWGYAQGDNGLKVQKVVDSLRDLTIQAKNTKGELENIGVGTILTTDDYRLKEQVEAYELALQSLEALGDKAAINSFTESFIQFERFSQYEDYVLDFVDSVGLSIDELNKFYDSWETLQKKGIQISREDWQTNFDLYLTRIAETNGDIVTATREVFGDYLDDSEDALNAFITAYGDLVEVGILNMGQNLEKLKNTVSDFYEKSLEWGSMSESEKAEFIADNTDLFSDGKLLEAFESGNYEQIEEALKNNTALQKQIEQRKKEVAQELLIERNRTGDDRNEAYIATLEKYEKYLNDAESMFKASLEVRLEQEQKQLDEYRSYLEEQQSALEESLEKRKEAYEKYFDSINQTEEDEEYEDQANLLINNISKLSSTSNASAQQQMKELEQQFKELEEERMKELRERAQEQIIENIDDELSEISDKFDKLLESNQALLAAMTGDLENPLEFIGNLLGGKIESGATALEIEDYIGTLQSTYGNVLGSGVNWEDIKVREENNQMFLTVNGQDILLDTQNEQNLYTAIMKALTEIGLR